MTNLKPMRVCAGALVIVYVTSIYTYSTEALSEQAKTILRQQFERAATAEVSGDNPSAYAIYTKATTDYPESSEAWAALGEHLRFYAHDEKAAASAFNKALKATQTDDNAAAFAWRGLGELASKEHQYDLAIDYFKKSLQAFPLADTHRSLCHLYCQQKNFKAAAEEARAAVKLSGQDPIALMLFAAQLHRAGETEEGRREFEKALQAGGIDAQGHSNGPVHCCVLYNAAGYLGVCADNPAALAMLKRFFETPNHRHISRTDIENDPDFEGIKNMPEFHKMLDTYLPEQSPVK